MISIIVPIHNVRPFLKQCIESLICQTLSEIEIILVDDGSTDGSSYICDEYVKKDSRITAIHKVNGGLVSARKAGLRAAQGQYIAFVDGDDWIEEDMYERMYRKMEEQAVDVVMCGRYEDVGSIGKEVFHGIPEGRYGKQELMHLVYPQMITTDDFYEYRIFPVIWDKLFCRECIEEFVFAVDDRITMGEDAACVYPCLLNVDSIFVMHECLYHYRQTLFSMIKKIPDPKEERERFQILYQSVNENLKKYINIYDVREQWNRFMLFLMIPRADGLYQGYGGLEYLFPFTKVKKGSKIVLYCAGTYGQRLYQYLKKTAFCQVTAWVDRNYLQLQDMGLPVENPEVLQERDYDAIVIANMFARSRKALYNELAFRYPHEKIHMLDEALIIEPETMRAFGL